MKKNFSPPRRKDAKEGFFQKPLNLAIIILGITFVVFFPTLKNDFIPTWDDEKYVLNNPVIRDLDLVNIRYMFTRPVNGTYVPLPLLTFAFENTLFGNNPLPYHATNLLLHLACTFLVFWLFRLLKLDLIYAAFAALLFGIHPMRVESVAWITERKDVLYGFFYLASIIAYIKHTQEENRSSKFFLISLLSFLLALLSKIEAVTLPLSLLLIDYFSKRPLTVKLFTEKIPYFILSLIFGVLGIIIIYRVGLKTEGFLKSNEMVSLTDRIFYGLYALGGYLFKFLLPVRQSALYLRPEITGFFRILFYVLNPIFLIVLGFFVYRSRKFTRTFIFGCLFFLANVIFLLQVFTVGIAFFADRFTYIPYIGLFFITGWSVQDFLSKKPSAKTTAIMILSVYCIILMFSTFNRCKVWKNDVTLWSDVIEKYPDQTLIPYINRGMGYTNRQEWENAIADFNKANAIDPKNASVLTDRGFVYGIIGQPQEAISDFTMALSLEPKNTKALQNRGVAYGNTGQHDKAVADFLKTIELDPGYVKAYVNLGLIYLQQKEYDRVMDISLRGLKIDTHTAELYTNLGNCYLEKGENDHAIEKFSGGLLINGSDLDAVLGMMVAYYNKNDMATAKGYLTQAMSLYPDLNQGLKGLDELERSGQPFCDRKKETLRKIFSSMR
jgi:protein O-mannosyl-transferase